MTAQNLLILLLILMGTTMETREAYKLRKATKFYRMKSWHRPRWRSTSNYAKYHRIGVIPLKNRAIYHRYAPLYEESTADDPYMIVIQLPRRQKYGGRRYGNYRGGQRDYVSEDYDDDYDDFEQRTFRDVPRDVRVKVTKGTRPKLHIKISRNDRGSEIVERSNATGMQVSLRPEVFTNYRRANSRTIQQTLLPPPQPPSLLSHQSSFFGI